MTLDKNNRDLVPSPKMVQGCLFQVEKQCEIDGIEMGVLENGIPYLTEAGLARMCGIDRKVLNRLAIEWPIEKTKPRGMSINSLLNQAGYNEDCLYLESEFNGKKINAYTEPVCMVLVEYYAFVAKEPRQEAINAFRSLAKRTFIPASNSLAINDRMDITSMSVPDGYFSIFHEIAGMIVPMIRSGVIISDKVIPDISVGKLWSAFWKENDFDKKYGSRIRYNHSYPDYYPQSKSNPQPSYAYPDSSLGEFRKWLREKYIYTNFPKYLVTKIKSLAISSWTAQKAIAAFSQENKNN